MSEVTTVRVDLAKNVFLVDGADATGSAVSDGLNFIVYPFLSVEPS
jgi:hypothetical protein